MSLVRALLPTAALALACAAQNGVPPASAEPRPPLRGTPRATATAPIGAANADRVKKLWEAAAGGRGRAVAIDAGLGRVAFGGEDGVSLYELASGKRLAQTRPCPEVLHRGTVFAGGKLMVACERSVQVFDPKKLAKLAPLPVHASKITAATLAPPHLALGHHDGVIRIYALDGALTREIPVPGPPIDVKSLALTRDGSRIAVAWIQGSIWWWDTDEPSQAHDLVRHDSESDALAFSRDGALLAEEGARHKTTLWALGAGAPKAAHTLENGAWVKKIAFCHGDKWLVRGGSDGLELAEIAGPRRVALDTRAAVEDVALDERGSRIAAVDRDGRLTVWAAR